MLPVLLLQTEWGLNLPVDLELIKMSARNDETWLFIVEWFDPMPRLKRAYQLRYFVQQHQVEMVDLKSKKMFLKKSPCTEETTIEDFAIGKKVFRYT